MEIQYWNPRLERASRREIEEIQLRKLRATVRRAYDTVPYYRETFDQHGLKPEHIQTLADVRRIPLFDKRALRLIQPYGILAVSRRQVARFHATSGTTGKPCMVAFTAGDVERMAELGARHFTCFGMQPGDMLYQGAGYGMWIGGWSKEQAARRLGITVFPYGPGRTMAAVEALRDYGHDAIACTPSFALYLVEQALQAGVNPRTDWKLRIGILGGEAVSAATRRRIGELMPAGFVPYNIYGTTELGGPFVAAACPYGMEEGTFHIWCDDYLVELVDPETGDPVEFGQSGELVVTTLEREAAPMLRWRTRDLTAWSENPYDCPCGRSGHLRLAWITGRSDDMIKLRGAMVFPAQIEDLVVTTPGLGDGWLLALDRDRHLHEATLHVEVNQPTGPAAERVGETLARRIRDHLGVRIPVVLHPLGALPRYEGKARRVVSSAELGALVARS